MSKKVEVFRLLRLAATYAEDGDWRSAANVMGQASDLAREVFRDGQRALIAAEQTQSQEEDAAHAR